MSDMMMMASAFTVSTTTPLYSASWTPASVGQYAGICIFLIVLAFVGRTVAAFKSTLERRWLEQALNRRYVVVADKARFSDEIRDSKDSDGNAGGVLTVRGVEQEVRIAQSMKGHGIQAWRFSVDLPRAAIYLVLTGIGYLLMLAVMTMNVGYFMSVLAGSFVGEVVWGRYINSSHH